MAAAVSNYQFLQRYELIRNFFQQLREQAINGSTRLDSLEEEAVQPQDQSDSVRKDEYVSSTQRDVRGKSKRQNRANYLQNKKQPIIQKPETKQLRPSDILSFESNKRIIDQLCKDNNVLNTNLHDALKVIDILKNKVKQLQSQNNQELQLQIKKLQQIIQIKDKEIQSKQLIINQCRQKFEALATQLTKQFQEIEEDQFEQEKSMISIQTQNNYLRKLLGIMFTEEQLSLIEKQQDDAEFNFYDNFCISRKDLEKKAIEQYEKLLSQRRQKIETQFIDWHVVYMNEQQKQQEKYMANQTNFPPNQDFLMYQDDPDENLYQQQKPKPKQVTKEEKDRILSELLKPIGGSNKQQQKLKDLTSANLDDQQQDSQSQKSGGIIRNKAMMYGDMVMDQQNSENEFIPSQKQQTEQEDENEENAKANSEPKSAKDKNKLSLQIDLIEKSEPKSTKNPQEELKAQLGLEDYEIEENQENHDALDNQGSQEQVIEVAKQEDVPQKQKEAQQSVSTSQASSQQQQQQQQQTGFKKTQKEIMQSLEQGWQKLLQSKQQRNVKQMNYEDDDTYSEEPFTYQGFPGNNIFGGPKTINYDQDDYFDDEDEDEIYQNIIQKQKVMGSKLQKTSKNEELQNRSKM